MNLQIRFADGTTEERAAASPCILDIFDPALKHPSEERWYLWFPDGPRSLSFCGRDVWTLDDVRRLHAMVWRITDQDATTKALIGEWQSAYVESREEQIERLTTERDNAMFVRDAWKVTASILAGQHKAALARAANAERERDAARRMVVIRSVGIKSSKEARELDALTNQAIEEGWLKVP
jgi:hypothetical protein